MADLSSDIETAAVAPKSHQVDNEKAESRPIGELIEADAYLKANDAKTAGKLPIGLFKIKAGGAVSRTLDSDS